jgi:hypothetical protein
MAQSLLLLDPLSPLLLLDPLSPLLLSPLLLPLSHEELSSVDLSWISSECPVHTWVS